MDWIGFGRDPFVPRSRKSGNN